MTYAAGFAILFAQPTGASYLVKELKFDYVGISWFIIFLALLMYGQDILSSWLVGKLMLDQQGIVKNRSAGQYNKIEMTDIGRDSYENAEEDNDGSDVQQIADNATV